MSKINAARLININYNHNAIRISDECLHLNGESTLLTLDNGGGKSVLVQMLTAPFVTKRFRNVKDRPFAGYFNSPRPSFIFVEWELDNNAGYVLTGMMVRQNQNTEEKNENELEMINIISEYSGQCLHDINHIPVVENSKGEVMLKSFASCRQLFDSYKKDRNKTFYSYDMNNGAQAKQYFDKLKEYGINNKEWEEIIYKINKEESGLSKLFEECRDEKGLIEKWFLKPVEEKLNRDKNRMSEFQDILGKYIKKYRDSRDKIKRRDTINSFQEESEKIKEHALELQSAEQAARKQLNLIRGFAAESERLRGIAEDLLKKEEEHLEEIDKQISRLDYERLSADYYAYRAEWMLHGESIEKIKSEIIRTENSVYEKMKNLHIMECARQQEIVDECERTLQRIKNDLEVARQNEKDLGPERIYLGWRLKCWYKERVGEGEASAESTADEIESAESAKARAAAHEDELRMEQSNLISEKGALQAEINAYSSYESRYASKYSRKLIRSMTGEYEAGTLDIHMKELQSEINATAKSEKQSEKQAGDIGSQIMNRDRYREELELKLRDNSLKLHTACSEKEIFEKEIEERRVILKYLNLSENSLFDTERILRESDIKLSELDSTIKKLTIEESALKNEIQSLQTGKTVELPEALSDVLDSLGIRIVYGMEWLKNNNNSEEQNLMMVRDHKFLPYALIMTEAELNRLMSLPDKVYTSMPIPVVTRESLAESANNCGEAEYQGVHFYMLFNENLLNEEKLAELLDDLENRLDRKKNELINRESSYRDYLDRDRKIRGQTVNESALNALISEINKLEGTQAELTESIAETKQNLESLNIKKAEIEKNINELKNRQLLLSSEAEDLRELMNVYSEYLENRNKLKVCVKNITELEDNINDTKRQQEEFEGTLITLRGRLNAINFETGRIREKSSAYEQYEEALCPEGLSDELLQDMEKAEIRYMSITDKVSHEIRELERNASEFGKRQQKDIKRLDDYAKKHKLTKEDWSGVRFSEAEELNTERQLEHLNEVLREENDKLSDEKSSEAVSRRDMDACIKEIEETCGETSPMSESDIHSVDYKRERAVLVSEKKAHNIEYSRLNDRINIYGSVLDALEQYREKAEEEEEEESKEKIVWEEDFSQFSQDNLRQFHGNLVREYNEMNSDVNNAGSNLERVLNRIVRDERFENDLFRKPIENLIALVNSSEQVLNQLSVTLKSYGDLMEKLMVDIAIIEEEKAHIVGLLQEYARNIHAQMGYIDKNSTINIRGKSVKMLKIGLPAWDENENLYHVRIEDMVDQITQKGVELLESGGQMNALADMVGRGMNTRELYDTVIGINSISIQLYKIEAQRELQINWSDVARNSGGEGFVSAFVVLSSLLYYMRRDDTDIFAEGNEGKVLLMDNPFAQTNASHLLKPLMDMAKKNNTQLICLTGLGGDSIYDRFDNIYVLKLIPARLSSARYLKSEHRSGGEPEIMSLARMQVADEEQIEMIF